MNTYNLTFYGDLPDGFDRAIAELAPSLRLNPAPGGTAVEVFRADRISVEKRPEGIRLGYGKRVELYRAISLLMQHMDEQSFVRTEQPCFETGVMFDVSRNAVIRPETLRGIFRRMALMGVNVGMMYTEETYEVPGEPYFGYLRGRYSIEELRGLDDYADLFGIELMPCIQTLGHLNRILHWPEMYKYGDNGEVLLADDEKTYALLERMIRAATTPYRSNRIHIGMDEAHGIGLGSHLSRFGYESPHTIIHRHLERVKQITDSLGLDAMMWSDMYFRPDSPSGGYYDSGEPSREAIESVVPGVRLVYWDYYHNEESDYTAMLQKHAKLTDTPCYFAGGVWTFAGPAPDYDKTIRTSVAALSACKKAGVPFVLATAWGDNGAEANIATALPGIALYAEFAYTGEYNETWLAERFVACCGESLEPFLGLSRFNTVPGMHATWLRPVNAAKFLLYQDPLVQLFAKDTEGLDMSGHYAALIEDYHRAAAHDGPFRLLFAFYEKLAQVLAGKCRWHEQIRDAVLAEDRKTAAELVETLQKTGERAAELREIWRELWLAANKPYGFEIIDGRMGAVCARLDTAAVRVQRWINAEGEDLPELREEPLPYTLREGGALFGSYAIGEIVSACKIDL